MFDGFREVRLDGFVGDTRNGRMGVRSSPNPRTGPQTPSWATFKLERVPLREYMLASVPDARRGQAGARDPNARLGFNGTTTSGHQPRADSNGASPRKFPCPALAALIA